MTEQEVQFATKKPEADKKNHNPLHWFVMHFLGTLTHPHWRASSGHTSLCSVFQDKQRFKLSRPSLLQEGQTVQVYSFISEEKKGFLFSFYDRTNKQKKSSNS